MANRIREEERVPTDEELEAEKAAAYEDPITNVLGDVVSGIMKGESLAAHHDQIRKYITNQQDRSELIANLLVTKDYQRLVSFLKARDILEQDIVKAALRSDLNISEKMALLQMVSEITTGLEHKVQAGASNVSDFAALMAKVDYTLQVNDATLKGRMKMTTSAGREIVRRVMHKLSKVVKEA